MSVDNFSTEGITIKDLVNQILSNWFWFALCGLFGICLGFIFYKYTPPNYSMKSMLLAKEEEQGVSIENLFGSNPFAGSSNLMNQVGILNSYTLHKQVLENLNWSYSWFKKDLFYDEDLYKNSPFILKLEDGFENSTGIPLNIIPISDKQYLVRVEGNSGWFGLKRDELIIEFEQIAEFGQVFHNDYFHFTLEHISGRKYEQGAEYILMFNRIETLTLAYQKNLQINLVDEKADLIQLVLEGNNPERGVDYLNELAKEYLKFGLYQKNRASENTVNFIDAQLSEIVDSLQLAGQNFTDFRSKNRVVDLGQEAGLVMERLEEVESQASMAQLRLDYYNNLNAYINDAAQMERVVAPSVVGITDPTLNALVIRLSELYNKRGILAKSGRNPSLNLIDHEIQITRESLEENLRNLLSNTEIELENLRQRKYRIDSQLATLPQTEQELIDIKRSFDLNNELYTFMLQKRAEAAITNASNVSDVQILDPSRLSTAVKVGPSLMKNLFFGGAMGIFIPLAITIFASAFSETITKKEELEGASSIPIIGTVVHNKTKSYLPVVEYPRSGISESIRSLRTNVYYSLKYQNNKVIAVHSMMTNEGKSFISLNLAASFAINNSKVLLLGADLRNPSLSHVLNCSKDRGLSTYLMGNHSFDDIIEWTKNNLSFIPAGPILPNPSELIGNGGFDNFLNQARERFEYIIIDNAPISLVTDGVLIGKSADLNLVIFRQGKSQKSQIKEINTVSANNIIPNLFLVFNDYQASKGGYGYGYGKGYGYYSDDSKSKDEKEFENVLVKTV